MKVAVGACLPAERDVNVDAGHAGSRVRVVFLGEVKGRALFTAIMLLAAAAGPRARAQSYSVLLHRVDGGDSSLTGITALPSAFSDQQTAFTWLQDLIPRLQGAGYLAASLDSIVIVPGGYSAYLFVGRKWRWARLSTGGLPPALLSATGISEAQFRGRTLSPKAIAGICERLLRWYEDNGYPFARVGLDSVVAENDGGVQAALTAEPGGLRRIDSIIIDGDTRLDKGYLMRYLDIAERGIYNESRVQTIQAKLRNLPFLAEGTTAQIEFRSVDTKLRIVLKERRANAFNAIIGLQPNTAQTGKFLLTADAQAAFQNLLGRGESFAFSYQQLQAASPRVKAEATYPYILGTPVGGDAHFDLYFYNETFRRTTYDAGARYAVSAQDYLRLFYRGYRNRIITPDTTYIRTYRRLPDNVDVNAAGGGLEGGTERLDYRLNPSRGWSLRASGEAMRRTVQKNDGITGISDGTGFRYDKLYDTLNAQTNQFRLSGNADKYFPLRRRIVLKGAYAGGWISGERLFQNELFQIGGLRLLRGFDEGSIFSNHYHIATLELQMLLSRSSAVYFFSDNAWVQSRINGFTAEGIYNGFGGGATLETAGGVFTIVYGLGISPANPVQLRQSKIHIGYVAYF